MPSSRPNILLLFTDDQRHDTIHALGNEQISTPNLDWLAHNGTAFSNAYIMGGSHQAVCMPSRAMLMTGRTLYHLEAEGQSIPSEHILLGEALHAAGYATFGAGKWHNGPSSYARCFKAGDDIFFGGMDDHWNITVNTFDPSAAYDRRRYQTIDFVKQRVVEKVYDHIHPGKHSSELFADAAIRFLSEQRSDQPFFCYVAFTAPHDPRTMPPEYMALYNPTALPLPANLMPQHPFDNGELQVRDELLAAFPRDPAEIRLHLAAYYAMISHLDAQVGRVLEALRAAGQADNTIIVMAGDNGLALGQHGLMGKQSLYEHSIHVPLLMSGPGITANRRSHALVYLLDIYPTLCELAGVSVPPSVEGQSFAPALRGEPSAGRSSLHFAYRHVQRAVRDERFKLIEYVVDGRRTTQLFDLAADPLETNNLSGDKAHASPVARLRGELARWREREDTGNQGDAFWRGYH